MSQPQAAELLSLDVVDGGATVVVLDELGVVVAGAAVVVGNSVVVVGAAVVVGIVVGASVVVAPGDVVTCAIAGPGKATPTVATSKPTAMRARRMVEIMSP